MTAFETAFELDKKFSENTFLSDGDLMQQVLMGWNVGETAHTCIVAFADFDDDIRNNMRGILNDSAKKMKEGDTEIEGPPDWYVMHSEAWVIKEELDSAKIEIPDKGPAKLKGPRPADRPDRIECLIVQGGTREGHMKTWMPEIIREPNLHLGDAMVQNSDDPINRSRVASMLWDDKSPDDEKLDGEFTTDGITKMNRFAPNLDAARNLANVIDAEVGDSEEEALNFAAGWLDASIEFKGLDEILPPRLKIALKKASNIIRGMAEKDYGGATFFEVPIKCLTCGLHFLILTFYEDWPNHQNEPASDDSLGSEPQPVYCPECGQSERFMQAEGRKLPGFIFQKVPGGQKITEIKM